MDQRGHTIVTLNEYHDAQGHHVSLRGRLDFHTVADLRMVLHRIVDTAATTCCSTSRSARSATRPVSGSSWSACAGPGEARAPSASSMPTPAPTGSCAVPGSPTRRARTAGRHRRGGLTCHAVPVADQATHTRTERAGPSRVLGLDAARGLAVVAMVIAHGLPFISGRISDSAAFVLQQVNDLASPLFALVMGVAAGLVFRRSDAARGDARAVVKGVALILLGTLLEQLDHWVAVILHILGLLLIVGTPLLRLASRWLLGLAAVLFVAGPGLIQAVTRAAGGVAGGQPPSASWATNPLVQWLVLNPHYRVLTLLPVFLVGAVLARRGIDDERTAWWCALAGLAMVWASFAAELLGHPVRFSGDLPDQVQENGLALAAYGARHGDRPRKGGTTTPVCRAAPARAARPGRAVALCRSRPAAGPAHREVPRRRVGRHGDPALVVAPERVGLGALRRTGARGVGARADLTTTALAGLACGVSTLTA